MQRRSFAHRLSHGERRRAIETDCYLCHSSAVEERPTAVGRRTHSLTVAIVLSLTPQHCIATAVVQTAQRRWMDLCRLKRVCVAEARGPGGGGGGGGLRDCWGHWRRRLCELEGRGDDDCGLTHAHRAVQHSDRLPHQLHTAVLLTGTVQAAVGRAGVHSRAAQ